MKLNEVTEVTIIAGVMLAMFICGHHFGQSKGRRLGALRVECQALRHHVAYRRQSDGALVWRYVPKVRDSVVIP